MRIKCTKKSKGESEVEGCSPNPNDLNPTPQNLAIAKGQTFDIRSRDAQLGHQESWPQFALIHHLKLLL